MAEKINIFKPKNDHSTPKWKHAGDTFREMIDLWEEAGYVNVIETNDPHDGSAWMYAKMTFYFMIVQIWTGL